MIQKLKVPNGPVIELAKVMAIQIETFKVNAELIFVDKQGDAFLCIGGVPMTKLTEFMTVIDEALCAFVNKEEYLPDWSFFSG